MTFKLSNPPYKSDNTPIYRVKLEEGVVGKANNNGTIVVKEGLTPEQLSKRRTWLMELCEQEGYNFTDRLHIIAYGDKRGV